MALELVYTSAPQGIKSGTRGFCTVACTRGIPAPMVATLESLSAYRHIYPPQDSNARCNPVNYSHLYLVSGGIPIHILSRVADAGLDYSQRTNKIAHHFVLSAKDLVAGGPAPLFTLPGLFRNRWNEEPVFFPSQRELYGSPRTPGVCRLWRELLGDPGWAGVLAASVELQRPVCLIFRPGQDLLPLFDEAIALLPEKMRWNATFSTYYTRIPPGIQCLWKAVVQNTIDEGAVRAIPGSVTVDLSSPCSVPLDLLSEPKTAFYVKLSREGFLDSSPALLQSLEEKPSVANRRDGSHSVPITTVAIPETKSQDEPVHLYLKEDDDSDSDSSVSLSFKKDRNVYDRLNDEVPFWLSFFVMLATLIVCLVIIGLIWYLVNDLTPGSAEKQLVAASVKAKPKTPEKQSVTASVKAKPKTPEKQPVAASVKAKPKTPEKQLVAASVKAKPKTPEKQPVAASVKAKLKTPEKQPPATSAKAKLKEPEKKDSAEGKPLEGRNKPDEKSVTTDVSKTPPPAPSPQDGEKMFKEKAKEFFDRLAKVRFHVLGDPEYKVPSLANPTDDKADRICSDDSKEMKDLSVYLSNYCKKNGLCLQVEMIPFIRTDESQKIVIPMLATGEAKDDGFVKMKIETEFDRNGHKPKICVLSVELNGKSGLRVLQGTYSDESTKRGFDRYVNYYAYSLVRWSFCKKSASGTYREKEVTGGQWQPLNQPVFCNEVFTFGVQELGRFESDKVDFPISGFEQLFVNEDVTDRYPYESTFHQKWNKMDVTLPLPTDWLEVQYGNGTDDLGELLSWRREPDSPDKCALVFAVDEGKWPKEFKKLRQFTSDIQLMTFSIPKWNAKSKKLESVFGFYRKSATEVFVDLSMCIKFYELNLVAKYLDEKVGKKPHASVKTPKERKDNQNWERARQSKEKEAQDFVKKKPECKQWQDTLLKYRNFKCQLEFQIRLKYFDDEYKTKWTAFKKEFETDHPGQILPDYIVLYESRGYLASKKIKEKPKDLPKAGQSADGNDKSAGNKVY